MKKLSQITIFDKNPIKKAIDSVNLKSKLNEVKSEVKDIGTSISNAISNVGNQNDQSRIPYIYLSYSILKSNLFNIV